MSCSATSVKKKKLPKEFSSQNERSAVIWGSSVVPGIVKALVFYSVAANIHAVISRAGNVSHVLNIFPQKLVERRTVRLQLSTSQVRKKNIKNINLKSQIITEKL